MATVDGGVAAAWGQGFGFGRGSYHYVWATKATMPAGRMLGLAGIVGGFLYYIGGQSTTTSSSGVFTVYKYDPSLNTWTTVTSLTAARAQAPAALINDIAYFPGGVDVGTALTATTGVQYNPTSGVTTVKGTIPSVMRLSNGASDAYDGKVYSLQLGVLAMYDPVLDTYTQKATDPSANGANCSGAFGADGKFHVFGGNGSLTTHRVYDPVANSWAAGTAIPSPGVQANPGVVLKNGLLHLIGGRNSSADIATVRTFDTLTNTWSTKPDLPAVRAYINRGACAAPGGFYVAGGASGSSGQTSLYYLRSPEVDGGVATAIGRGIAEAFAAGKGTAVGEGTAEADGEAQFTGKRMAPSGFVPLTGDRYLDYTTDRSPVR